MLMIGPGKLRKNEIEVGVNTEVLRLGYQI